MSKVKVFDDSMAIGRGFGRVENRNGNAWTDGEVVTKHGIVSVYAQGDAESHYHTRLDFAWKGRLYMRNFPNKRYSKRGLVTLAVKFAAEITGES